MFPCIIFRFLFCLTTCSHCCCGCFILPSWASSALDRREILQQSFQLPVLLLAAPPPETALRRATATIPGYGAADVYYPVEWQGTWNMTRQVSFFGNNNDNQRELLVEYPVRFLLFDTNTVIADRAFNQVNFENAVAQRVVVRSTQWSSSNPNVLTLQYNSNKSKQIKVTKRATERTATTVFSSEFQLVIQDNDRGIPIIFPRRVVTQWRINNNSDDSERVAMEGIETVYDMTRADPTQQSTSTTLTPTNIVSKSKMRLQRFP